MVELLTVGVHAVSRACVTRDDVVAVYGYGYYLSDDKSVGHIHEHYRDSENLKARGRTSKLVLRQTRWDRDPTGTSGLKRRTSLYVCRKLRVRSQSFRMPNSTQRSLPSRSKP